MAIRNCGLTREQIIKLHEIKAVLLIGGRCQNSYTSDGAANTCNQFVADHKTEAGKIQIHLFHLYDIICSRALVIAGSTVTPGTKITPGT